MRDANKGAAPDAGPLLTQEDFCRLLGIRERKFHQLRAAGIVGAPLELGKRVSRWTQEDFLETVQRLPRRQVAEEPQRLATARRARIDSLKAAR